MEAVDNILLRDVGDCGACVEETMSVGSQELVMFRFVLRQTVMSTCLSDRPLEVVGKTAFRSRQESMESFMRLSSHVSGAVSRAIWKYTTLVELEPPVTSMAVD
jgi:hypothetical protein